MAAYLLFVCVCVNQTYWPHFGLDILLNFGHGMEVRNEGLLALKQKNIKFAGCHYESDLFCMEAVTALKHAMKVCDFSQ